MEKANANQQVIDQAMAWLNEKPRSKVEIAQKICDAINVTYDLMKKKSASDEMRFLLFKELIRPLNTGL